MGRDKARLRWQGASLAAREAALLATVCEPVVLVGGSGRSPVPGVPVVADRRPGEGPLAGLEAALEVAAGAAVLLLACDLPAVDDELIAELARCGDGFGAAGPEARVAVDADASQPLCALYSATCAPVVAAALDRGERSARSLLRSLGVTRVEASGRLVNVNTPEEWERWTTGQRSARERS